MQFEPQNQYTVSQNKSETFKAYGVTVSKKEWEQTQNFHLNIPDIASETLELKKLQNGNIIGFKELKPGSSEYVRPYRLTVIERNEHVPIELGITPPGKTRPVKRFSTNIDQIKLFSIVQDHLISCLYGQPELTISTEL